MLKYAATPGRHGSSSKLLASPSSYARRQPPTPRVVSTRRISRAKGEPTIFYPATRERYPDDNEASESYGSAGLNVFQFTTAPSVPFDAAYELPASSRSFDSYLPPISPSSRPPPPPPPPVITTTEKNFIGYRYKQPSGVSTSSHGRPSTTARPVVYDPSSFKVHSSVRFLFFFGQTPYYTKAG